VRRGRGRGGLPPSLCISRGVMEDGSNDVDRNLTRYGKETDVVRTRATRDAPTATPRPYQEAALSAIEEAFQTGKRRLLVTTPTGTGKTNMFTWLIGRRRAHGPALVLAHRDELIHQAVERIGTLL